MAFTSDTTRTWGADFETLWGERINPALPLVESNCDARYYRSFWINAIRWLGAAKIGKTNDAVTLELAQSYSLPNQTTTARIKIRDSESREISGAEVSVAVSANGKSILTQKAAADRGKLSYVAGLRPPVAGNYTITATATLGGKKLGADKQLLICEGGDLEMLDVRARPDLMAEIARASGGKDLTSEPHNAALLASALGNVPPAVVDYRHTPLWDKAGWLAAIVGLLTMEWMIRRFRGLAEIPTDKQATSTGFGKSPCSGPALLAIVASARWLRARCRNRMVW